MYHIGPADFPNSSVTSPWKKYLARRSGELRSDNGSEKSAFILILLSGVVGVTGPLVSHVVMPSDRSPNISKYLLNGHKSPELRPKCPTRRQ
jgi:hypothetical protein